MEFEWDEAKRRETLRRRKLDFRFVQAVFDDPLRIDRPDIRRVYGEDRRQAIGEIGDKIYFVAYTMRGDIARIISARRAHDNEEKKYRESKENEYRAAVGQEPVD